MVVESNCVKMCVIGSHMISKTRSDGSLAFSKIKRGAQGAFYTIHNELCHAIETAGRGQNLHFRKRTVRVSCGDLRRVSVEVSVDFYKQMRNVRIQRAIQEEAKRPVTYFLLNTSIFSG